MIYKNKRWCIEIKTYENRQNMLYINVIINRNCEINGFTLLFVDDDDDDDDGDDDGHVSDMHNVMTEEEKAHSQHKQRLSLASMPGCALSLLSTCMHLVSHPSIISMRASSTRSLLILPIHACAMPTL